jgi:hypothetical protein
MALSRHKPRRSHISGKEGVRARARRIARSRSHGNFMKFLSGYDSNGAASGPIPACVSSMRRRAIWPMTTRRGPISPEIFPRA